MKADSYRGIILTSMVAKVLEFLSGNAWNPTFLRLAYLTSNQSAYGKGV